MENNQLIQFPLLERLLIDISEKAQEFLRNNFIGFYIQGSLALGGFDQTSDVDFIIVTKEELTENEIKEWEIIHQLIYDQDNRYAKRLEYSFFPIKIFTKLSSPYPQNANRDTLWYFDNGSRTVEKSDHCNAIIVRWTVREKGIALAGPNPKTLIDPIPVNNLRTEIKNTLEGWGRELMENHQPFINRFYQSYLVLNFCRMLHDLYHGRAGTKLEGITWAKTHLDPAWIDHIDFCWEERKDANISVRQPAEPILFKKTMAFVEYIINECQKYNIEG